MAGTRGLVTQIQHFCIHDGPGIRSVVFLKGCTLQCAWCCNPENMSARQQLGVNPGRCIGSGQCGRCLPLCPQNALTMSSTPGTESRIQVNRNLCASCFQCVSACPAKAFTRYGNWMTVQEVLDIIQKESTFYAESGGGITLSGGECLMQADFSASLLEEARNMGLSTAIETAGNVPWDAFAKVLPYTDIVMHDYKCLDDNRHKELTGVPASPIINNFRRAYAEFPNVRFIARTPLIAGINDTMEHVEGVLNLIRDFSNVEDFELLPFHELGSAKWNYVGNTPRLTVRFEKPTPEVLAGLREHIAGFFHRRTSGNKKIQLSGLS